MKQSYYIKIFFHNEKVVSRKGEIIRIFSDDEALNEEIGESITYLKKGVMLVPKQIPASIAEELIKRKRAKIISSNKAKEADLLKRLRYVKHLSDNDRFRVFLKVCPDPSKQNNIEGEFTPFTDEQINQVVQEYIKYEQKDAHIQDSKIKGKFYTLTAEQIEQAREKRKKTLGPEQIKQMEQLRKRVRKTFGIKNNKKNR